MQPGTQLSWRGSRNATHKTHSGRSARPFSANTQHIIVARPAATGRSGRQQQQQQQSYSRQQQHSSRSWRWQLSAVAAPAAGAMPQDKSRSLDLADVRSSLIRQEDTIIFSFIERAQFARNDPVYQSGAIPVPAFGPNGERYSLLEYVLRETEQLHGSVRRYTSPLEHPFYPEDVPALVLPPMAYNSELAPCASGININDEVMRSYMEVVLPGITSPGDDNNYGSAATLDILCLQALSKRIHYGKFVAEAKFRARPEDYTSLIKAQDVDGLMQLLTDLAVEHKVVERVRLKAATFGQDISTDAHTPPSYKVAPDVLASIYNDVVMPLTKEVQVAYLLRRLD